MCSQFSIGRYLRNVVWCSTVQLFQDCTYIVQYSDKYDVQTSVQYSAHYSVQYIVQYSTAH